MDEDLDGQSGRFGEQENLALLASRSRKQVNAFLKGRVLPDDLSPDFLQAVREVLTGLVKVVLKPEELRTVLRNGARLPRCRK